MTHFLQSGGSFQNAPLTHHTEAFKIKPTLCSLAIIML